MNKLSIIFLLLFSQSFLFGQINLCGGNVGINLFEEGDFGSGSSNILSQDPGIAPGYTYNADVPPYDGEYLLTNSTLDWNFIYNTWLQIGDNSENSDGYMMVVNASFEPGLFYNQIIDGLCENTLYQFSADIINMIRPVVTDHIKPNVTFLIDGTAYYNTGEVPQDAAWHTYGFTFSTDPGQTSVRLSLRNNARGGIGNDLALDNITFSPCGPLAYITGPEILRICEDGSPARLTVTIDGDEYEDPSFIWQQSFDQGISWDNIPGVDGPVFIHTQLQAGDYYYRFLLANGDENLKNSKCRIVSDIKIVRVDPLEWFIRDTICAGSQYFFGDKHISVAGQYVDSLVSSIGCDSIVTLELSVLDDTQVTFELIATDPSCFNKADGQISIRGTEYLYNPFRVFINGVNHFGTTEFNNLESGMYELSVHDRFSCFSSIIASLSNPQKFEVALGEDQNLLFGDAAVIDIQSNYDIDQYFWQPANITDCTNNCQQISWYPFEDTEITLKAFSDAGCEARDTIFIRVEDERRVYIPSAFSPNDDGINDVFYVYGHIPTVASVEKLEIYDRWGNMVFRADDMPPNRASAGWDGKLRGNKLNTAVFTYCAKINFFDNTSKTFIGDVLLLR